LSTKRLQGVNGYLLESAVWWPEPVEVEYRPTDRRRWLVDGRPVTKAGAAWVFRRVGLKHEEIRCLMRIQQHCYEIEARRPPPPPDTMSVEEFCRLLADGLAYAVNRRIERVGWDVSHLTHRQHLPQQPTAARTKSTSNKQPEALFGGFGSSAAATTAVSGSRPQATFKRISSSLWSIAETYHDEHL
jgi:hypothetical protein